MARTKVGTPMIPYGTVITDPCLQVVPITRPLRFYIDLEVCRKLFPVPSIAIEMYWGFHEEIMLPPIKVRKIIEWMNVLRIEPFPGQLRQYKRAEIEARNGVVVLRRPANTAKFGFGWFEVLDWDGIEEVF